MTDLESNAVVVVYQRARLSHLEMRRGFWLIDVRKAIIKSMGGVEYWECQEGEKPKEAMWRMMGVEK